MVKDGNSGTRVIQLEQTGGCYLEWEISEDGELTITSDLPEEEAKALFMNTVDPWIVEAMLKKS